jgi:hypothetical protein
MLTAIVACSVTGCTRCLGHFEYMNTSTQRHDTSDTSASVAVVCLDMDLR